MKHASIALCAASMLAVTAAHAETRNFDLTGFASVESSAGVDVEITVGGGYSIRAEGDAEALDHLRIELDGDTLEIGRENTGLFSFGRKGQATVYVTTPTLESISASSGSDLSAVGIDAAEFEASVSSGADAELSGTCGSLKADGSSGADLDAEDLKCTHAVADVSSGADLTIYASESLEADASSGGDITVYGGPTNTDIDKSSGGGVTIRD
jgi:hypothetical protein